MWSFSDWIESQSFMFQANFDALLSALPFFLGWTMISFYYQIARPSIPQDPLQAIGIWGQIISPGIGVAAGGWLIVSLYKNSVRQRAQRDPRVIMTIWWKPTLPYDEDNLIKEITVLKEEEVESLLKIPYNNEGGKKTLALTRAQSVNQSDDFTVKYGNFYYAVIFRRHLTDPDGEKWDRCILLADFPHYKFMRDVPGQFIFHQGVFVPIPAAKVNLVYCDEFTDVGMPTEDGFVKYKVFRVGFDPQRVLAMQETLGLAPASVTKDNVKIASQLVLDRSGIYYARQARETGGQLRAYGETHQDSRERAVDIMGKFFENSDEIRNSKKWTNRFSFLKNRNALIRYALIAVIAFILLRYWGVIKF